MEGRHGQGRLWRKAGSQQKGWRDLSRAELSQDILSSEMLSSTGLTGEERGCFPIEVSTFVPKEWKSNGSMTPKAHNT